MFNLGKKNLAAITRCSEGVFFNCRKNLPQCVEDNSFYGKLAPKCLFFLPIFVKLTWFLSVNLYDGLNFNFEASSFIALVDVSFLLSFIQFLLV